jgi:diguanylate cyclase (GGDEF)-like protein
MVMIILSILTLCLIALFLGYYWKQQNHTKESVSELQSHQLALKKAREIEQQLREELALLENKLKYMFEDPVTHLLGWQVFEDRLTQTLKESVRYQFTPGILFIDLDDFKMINNALGYKVGDALLVEVGQRLQSCIRQIDSVSRFTKDTFVILLAQLAKPETAAIVAQRILHALEQPFHIQEHDLYISTCIGIAVYPYDGTDASSLLGSADHALYLAKEKGKNTYQFYQEKIHTDSHRELALSSGLNQETVFDNFVIYYQPVMNANNKKIICMDALLYWQHPELGMIAAAELMHFAEKQHKLNVIFEWLLLNACKQFFHWRELGFEPHLLSIPVSMKQLENSSFVYRISQILQEMNFKPECLLLAIKGNIDQPISEGVEKSLNMLQYLNIRIAIDCFGSNSFSLLQLTKVTVDYFRLDPALITELDTNAQARVVMDAILYLAKKMSMELIVQGVESEQQIQELKALGYTLMQGQAIGAPLPAEEVVEKMVATIA